MGKYFSKYVVHTGERVAVWGSDGSLTIVDGPETFWKFSNTIQSLPLHVAEAQQYLVVRFKDGHTQHLPGPTSLYFDPIQHLNIIVQNATNIETNEVLIVYRRDEKGNVQRSIIKGPTLHIPTVGEWVHQFCWHGKDPHASNNKAILVPGVNKFSKLRTVPAHFYLNVSDVRTSDDMLLTCKFMIFYELRNLELMLEQTLDPIGDFKNALCADTVAFASTLSYVIFLEKTALLSQLNTFPQVMSKAKQTGYEVTKVVFRGYFASDKLQTMQDDAMQSRTAMRLQNETAEQQQQIEDLKLLKEMQRAQKKHEMDQRAAEFANSISRKQHEEKLYQEIRMNEEKLKFYTELKKLGVDVTKYLLAQTQPQPHKLIQVMSDKDAPQVVVKENVN